MLGDAMRRLAAKLRADYAVTAGIEHRGLKGGFREASVRDAFLPHLPPQYRATSGIVVNSSGSQSRQQDFLIADSIATAPFVFQDGTGVFPIEMIAGALEIKSVLTLAEVSEAVINVASVKSLMPPIARTRMVDRGDGIMGAQWTINKPFGAIIGLSTQNNIESLRDRFLGAALSIEAADRPNAMLVLDRGLCLWSSLTTGGAIELAPSAAKSLLLYRSQQFDDLVLLFYAILVEHLQGYTYPPFRVLEYLEAAGPVFQVQTTVLPQP